MHSRFETSSNTDSSRQSVRTLNMTGVGQRLWIEISLSEEEEEEEDAREFGNSLNIEF